MKVTTKFFLFSFIGLIVLVALVVASLLYIRVHTTKKWEDFRAHWEAKGERFEVEQFIPDPIPDDENLAYHPVFEGLYIEGSEAGLWFEELEPSTLDGYAKKTSLARIRHCVPADFADWGELDQGLTQEERLSEITRRFAPLNEPLNLVAMALRERPKCQFPIDTSNMMMLTTPHTFIYLHVTDAFQVRANLSLLTDDSAQTLEDFTSLQLLASAASQDNTLVGYLVEIAIQMSSHTIIWQGIHQNAFNDQELKKIDDLLSQVTPFPERLMDILRMERASMLQLIDILENNPGKITPSARTKNTRFMSLWWSTNRLAISEGLQKHTFAPGGTFATIPTIEGAAELEREFENQNKGIGKYTRAFAIMSTPALNKAVAKVYQIEAYVNNARLAIALERFRLSNGAYPKSLSELVPEFLAGVPEDRCNSRPIEYRIKDDGTPLIYHWGCDGDDDGGRPRKKSNHGDYVWQYTIDPPLTDDEFLKED